MQIKEKGEDGAVDVYGVYWAKYFGRNERFFLIIPEENYPGFLAVPGSQCEITDPSLDGLIFTHEVHGQDALLHPILLDKDLLNRLIDHDTDAMKSFQVALKSFS